MAATGGFDFNLNQQLGQKATKSSPDDANNKESVAIALEGGAEKVAATLGKFLGVNAGSIGTTSMFTGLESEGFSGKMIPSMFTSLNTQGGVIAQIAAVLMKNGVVNNGVGGEVHSQQHASMGESAHGGHGLPSITHSSGDVGLA